MHIEPQTYLKPVEPYGPSIGNFVESMHSA